MPLASGSSLVLPLMQEEETTMQRRKETVEKGRTMMVLQRDQKEEKMEEERKVRMEMEKAKGRMMGRPTVTVTLEKMTLETATIRMILIRSKQCYMPILFE